jgi:micrococcal nuclease
MTRQRRPGYQPRLLSLAMLLTAIGLLAASPPATTLTGKVVKIADGDTLTLLVGKTQVKVRLDGIDTPERAQPFGRKTGQALAKKVIGSVVRCHRGPF